MKLSTKQNPPAPPSLESAANTVLANISMELLEQLFENKPDIAFFVKDAQGRYVAVNTSLMERHGIRHRDEMIGLRPSDVCPGDFGQIPVEQDKHVLGTGRPIIERLELQWYSPNKPGWCLTTKLPIKDASGKVVGIIGMSKDVRTPVAAQEIPPGVAAALGHLETSYGESLSPSDLAAIAGLPAPRFARVVRRIFGMTPIQLIAKTRIAAAARMLRETDLPVARIAVDCGFYDHSAFTRAFRSAMSATPTEFRANPHP